MNFLYFYLKFDAQHYEWILPAGWTGNSASDSISVISNGQGGTISVRAFSDSCGFSEWQTKTVYRIMPPEVPLCLVTVDENSTHNIVLWKAPVDASLIDSFLIYRETTSGVYSKIGSVSKSSLANYHDLTANPNTTSYRYKLSVLDICGVESPLSPYHSTIHLQNFGDGNFQWTFYQIEGAPNPVISFNVYRDNFGNGDFNQIGFVPGTNSTFTDITHASYPSAVYVVDVNWDVNCDQIIPNLNTTRSNIRRKTDVDTTVSAQVLSVAENIAVFPNPAGEIITIQTAANIHIRNISVSNMLGRLMRSEQVLK